MPQAVAVGAALLLVTPVVVQLAVQVRGRRALDATTPSLRRATSGVHHTAWRPPPVTDATAEVNGFAWQQDHSQWARSIAEPTRTALRVLREQGGPVPPEVAVWLQANDAAIEGYAHAAGAREAHEDVVVAQGFASPVPSYLPLLRAHQVYLAREASRGPDRCLAAAAPAARLAQQLVPGAAVVGALIAGAMIQQTVATVRRCAPEASPAARADASRLLELVVRSPAPWEDALANEALLALTSLHQLLDGVPTMPRNPQDCLLGFVRLRTVPFLERWLAPPGPWARFSGGASAAERRAAFARFEAELAALPEPAGTLALALEGYDRRTLAAEGELRRFALALRFLVARDQAGGALPTTPPLLEDPAFHDPLTGRPFRWAVEGARVRFWSEHPQVRDLRTPMTTELQLPP